VVSSALADFASDLVLVFATFHIAQLIWAFGPIQVAAVLFFALTLIAGVTGTSVVKGLFSACMGLLLASVGMDPSTAGERFTFGSLNMMEGLHLVPVLIGLFAVSEVFTQIQRAGVLSKMKMLAPPPKHPDDSRLTWKEFMGLLPTIGISYVIGMIIGIIPGLGASVAPWVAYGQVRSFSKNPENFGKGELKGVAAAEAANNATCGANLIPLLTLGIPGSTTVAIIMAIFMLHGIEFGPQIFERNSDLVYGIFASGFIAIFLYFVIGYFFARKVGELITKIRIAVIYPVILIITVIGAYASHNSLFDVGVLITFGILGYVMRKTKFPLPPLVIAFILGNRFEAALRKSLVISDNGILVFFTDPIAGVITSFSVLLLAWNIYRQFTSMRRGEKAVAEQT